MFFDPFLDPFLRVMVIYHLNNGGVLKGRAQRVVQKGVLHFEGVHFGVLGVPSFLGPFWGSVLTSVFETLQVLGYWINA